MIDVILPQVIGLVGGLIGVLVGGGISYLTQIKNDRRTEDRKDKRQKHIAYNHFLLLDGTNSPLEHPIHHENEKHFSTSIYNKGTRKILYNNLHLFDRKITRKVLEIDSIGEEAEAMGTEMQHIFRTYDLYLEIKELIKDDYKNDINT